MEYEKIKKLIEDMSNSKLSAFDIELADGTKISMKKAKAENGSAIEKTIIEITEDTETESEAVSVQATQKTRNKIVSENKKVIKSPMVGTFYSKPSPTQSPYVEIGKSINKGEVVCIVEAMKLMNEIESEYSGKIAEILIKDGEMVEYGTPLFVIE